MFLFKDDMKKETKRGLVAMIMGYSLLIISVVLFSFSLIKDYQAKDILIICLFCFCVASLGLYAFLYAMKYKLEVSETQINLITLFSKVSINVNEIDSYTYKKYGIGIFYVFSIISKGKKITISTRYVEEMKRLLDKSKVAD